MDSETNEPAFGKPYIVKTLKNGIKLVILGVTKYYIPNLENETKIRGLALGKKVVREVSVDMAELVADYMLKHGVIKADSHHNWRVVIDLQ